jgi:hypothetical protein
MVWKFPMVRVEMPTSRGLEPARRQDARRPSVCSTCLAAWAAVSGLTQAKCAVEFSRGWRERCAFAVPCANLNRLGAVR